MPDETEKLTELEERLLTLEEQVQRLRRRVNQRKGLTDNPLSLDTDLDDLGAVKTYLEFEEAPLVPGVPLIDALRLYVKDIGGVTLLVFQNSEGVETTLTGAGRSLGATYWHYDDILNWVSDNIVGICNATVGGAGSIWTGVGSEASHPGIWSGATGTTATGHARLSSMADGIMFSNGKIRFGTVIKTDGTLSTAAQRYTLYTGIVDTANPDGSTDGVYIRYRDNINGGKWQARVANGGGFTDLDTGVLAVINTWYFLEMEINAAGNSVEFFINGASVGTIASGPAANSTAEIRTGILKSVGTTSRLAYWDAYYLYGELTTAR